LMFVHDDSEFGLCTSAHRQREYGPSEGMRRYKLASPTSGRQPVRRAAKTSPVNAGGQSGVGGLRLPSPGSTRATRATKMNGCGC
jgi:hypothetical protein